MPTILFLIMGLPLITALSSCGGNDAEREGVVADSAGIAIVSNSGEGLWPPGGGWTVEEDLRIGSAVGQPEYQFGTIAGIDVGADGQIYVLDQQASLVRVFNSEGQFVLTIGRGGGAGPGELSQRASAVFVRSDGGVVVPDMGNQRINSYSADGQDEPSRPLPLSEGVAVGWTRADNDDLIYQLLPLPVPDRAEERPSLILRRDSRGVVTDTLLVLPTIQTPSYGGPQSAPIFSAETRWAFGDNGRLIHGLSSEYRMYVRTADGTLERIIEKSFEQRPVTPADQEVLLREIGNALERANVPPQAIQRMMGNLSFADSYPAYASLRAGPDGTVWAQSVRTPEDVPTEGRTFDVPNVGGDDWDVFRADGRFLGVVHLPSGYTPIVFVGEEIYGVIRDELDVEYVARLKVRR